MLTNDTQLFYLILHSELGNFNQMLGNKKKGSKNVLTAFHNHLFTPLLASHTPQDLISAVTGPAGLHAPDARHPR